MRVDLQKVLFIGPATQRESFLAALQKRGKVQFVGAAVSCPDLLANEFHDVVQAVKILNQYEVPQTPDVEVVEPRSFAQSILETHQKLLGCKVKLKEVREDLQLLAPFGQIPFDLIVSIEAETQLQFRLFMAPIKRDAAHHCPDLICVGEDNLHQYFVALTKKEISHPVLEPVHFSEEGAKLPQMVASLQVKINDLENELRRQAHLVTSLKRSLIDSLNTSKRVRTGKASREVLDNRLFSLIGWVPTTDLQDILALTHLNDVFTDLLPTLPDETPPTYLENHRLPKIGEDLVNIYDTPSHTDKDPSTWVLVFFSLFFAMIIGDAGYGMIFLLTALFLRKKAKTESGGFKRFVTLIAILGATSVAWGLATNNFFAIKMSPDNPLKEYSPLTFLAERQAQYRLDLKDALYQKFVDLHDDVAPTSVREFLYHVPSPEIEPFYTGIADSIMLELALLVGSLHIILSVCRYIRRNIANAGWIPCIVGGYMYFANFLHAPSLLYYLFGLDPQLSASIGLQMLAAGLLFTLTISVIKNGFADLFLVALGAVSVFADVLSYLRLYALGLSGGIVAGMINSLAGNFPFVISVILIVLSHAVNLSMSIVSGVIHGLRLNFLEWYHYSFDGGGKPFTPLNLETYEQQPQKELL